MTTQPATGGQQIKCPNCNGAMAWDASIASLRCGYCNHRMAPPGAAGPAPVATPGMPPPTAGAPAPSGGAYVPREIPIREGLTRAPRGLGAEVRAIQCRECGATVNVGPHEQTAACTYCASTMVMVIPPDPNLITPESLVPFLVPRERAAQAFKDWLAGLWFRPNDLKTMAKLEQIAGVYVPFWTFDAEVFSKWSGERGDYYYTEEQYTEVENGQTVTKTRQVRHTRWTPVSGQRNDRYNDVLVCGSKGMPPELVDRFSTFDTSRLVQYAPHYLAGWRAESYAIDLSNAWVGGQQKINSSQEQRCRRDIGGDEQRIHTVHNTYNNETFKHVLLPVYVAAYRYQNKPFRFLVNGQTGEVVGESPLSWFKIIALIVFILAVIGVIVALTQNS